MSRAKSEIGNRYGRLKVVSQVPSRGRYATWRCQCDCGRLHEATGANLRNNSTRSCGCLADRCGFGSRFDLTGLRFGRLIATSPTDGKGTRWNCRCDCGREATVQASHLRHGSVQSCGCLYAEVMAARYEAQRSPIPKRIRNALNSRRSRERLNTCYVTEVLRMQSGISRAQIPPSAVEAKRLELSIKRLSKEMSK